VSRRSERCGHEQLVHRLGADAMVALRRGDNHPSFRRTVTVSPMSKGHQIISMIHSGTILKVGSLAGSAANNFAGSITRSWSQLMVCRGKTSRVGGRLTMSSRPQKRIPVGQDDRAPCT
jgi:hypothetical protein